MRALKRAALGLVALFALAGSLTVSSCAILSRPLPQGSQGEEAERFATAMLQSVNFKAWERTGAVSWEFPRGHEHLWDRRRGYARVRWDEREALIDLASRRGVVCRGGGCVEEPESVEKAWAMWANDSFWLNPVVKIRDPGTTRELIVTEQGQRALLVSYNQGGVTPGDAYLWEVDEETMRPVRWRMWVSILPLKGMAFEWERWITLSTGALVAADHDGLFDVNLKGIRGAATLSELLGSEEEDPFMPLEQLLQDEQASAP